MERSESENVNQIANPEHKENPQIFESDKRKNIGLFYLGQPNSLPQERIQVGINILRENGFEITNPEIVTKKKNAEERAEEFMSVYTNPEVDLMMSFWGGRNTNTTLKHIDYEYIKKNPKPIVGYSDTSALLLAIYAKTGMESFYGNSFVTLTKGFEMEYSLGSFLSSWRKKILIHTPQTVNLNAKFYNGSGFDKQANEGIKVYKSGIVEATGILTCINTLSVLIGTEYIPDLSDKLLFLELSDSSNLDGLERFFAQLSDSKHLEKISGLALSKFANECKIQESDIFQLLEEYTKKLDIPIVYNLDFGHTDPISTFIVGAKYRLDTANKTLEYIKNVS
jgi:muramoyltetrapeptide carboxypeptidase